jgi:hypothetical protein
MSSATTVRWSATLTTDATVRRPMGRPTGNVVVYSLTRTAIDPFCRSVPLQVHFTGIRRPRRIR